jgi:hypothetical protein
MQSPQLAGRMHYSEPPGAIASKTNEAYAQQIECNFEA